MERDSSPTNGISGDDETPSLVERPEVLKRLVRAMPAPVMMLDGEWRILAHSERLSTVFIPSLSSGDEGLGSRLEGAEEPLFFDVFSDEKGAWRDTFERCLDQRRRQRGNVRPLRMGEATTYWVDWEVRPWRAPEEDAAGLLLSVTDRTGQHRAETMRRQVEHRFDALIDTISEGVLLMDNQGVFRDCNDVAERILGRPATEIIGTKFNDPKWKGLRKDGTPLQNSDFPFWRAFFEREPVRNEVMGIYPPDEPPRWIRVNARPLFQHGAAEPEQKEPYGVLVCFDDITAEQLKDEALQTSRDLLSSVLSSSLDGIMVFSAIRDEFGRIEDFECLLVNPQAEKLIGRSSDEIIGSRMLDLMPAQEEKGLFDAYCEVVETGEPLEAEVEYDTDSFQAWFQVVAVKIEDGVAVTLRDVSDRKEAAQAMAAANAKLEQRNRALRDFAYIASHDLQEPLRKISAFSNLVLEDYGDKVDETGQHYLERMQDAAQRMSQLISDLLVYSRVTTRARPFEPVDLESVVDNVRSDLDMQIEDVGGTVETDELPTIDADPTQMRQLLQNLISNALKFRKEEEPPVVRLTATVTPVRESDLADRIDVDCTQICQLTIEDNGIGFDQKYADRIFTPFKRLHGRSEYEGTGMGLAICRRIVERHGGNISVSSVPGDGTTFTVLLPVDRNGTASDESTPGPASAEADDGTHASGHSTSNYATTE